jgi:hypothetical protein
MKVGNYEHNGTSWVNVKTGSVINFDPRGKPTLPMTIMHDIEAHMAPGGHYVGGRASLKELENRHDLVRYERIGEFQDAPTTPFSKQDDRWKQWLRTKSEKVAKRAGLDPQHSAIEREFRGELQKSKAKVLAKAKA